MADTKPVDSGKPSPAQTVASSDDLLREIFPRLRPKQLARFKQVCKRWNSLISDPDLLRSRPPKPANGLICSTSRGSPFSLVPFERLSDPTPRSFPNYHRPFSSIVIMHSCNGLLVCSSDDECRLTNRYFVLNPTTMQHTTLPDPTVINESMKIRGMCLAFDPSVSSHYKVVCVSEIYGSSSSSSSSCLYHRFEVYSSETGSWGVRADTETLRAPNLDIGKGVYWNGGLHWIARYRSLDSIYFNPDCEDEIMHRVFPTPPTPCWSASDYTAYFGESCGHLLYFVYNKRSDEVTLYEMRRDYSEWFVKYTSIVDGNGLSPLYQSRAHLRGLYIYAVVWGTKDEDRFLIFNTLSERIITRYNIVFGTFSTLHDLPPHRSGGVPLLYFESACLV